MGHGVAHGGVGVEHDPSAGVVDQPDWQRGDQLAAAGLGQHPATQPGLDEVQLGLAHLAFHPQQQPVVELAGIVEAVFVADQRARHGAQLEQLVPVCGVAGQARAFQPEYDPGPTQRDLGD